MKRIFKKFLLAAVSIISVIVVLTFSGMIGQVARRFTKPAASAVTRTLFPKKAAAAFDSERDALAQKIVYKVRSDYDFPVKVDEVISCLGLEYLDRENAFKYFYRVNMPRDDVLSVEDVRSKFKNLSKEFMNQHQDWKKTLYGDMKCHVIYSYYSIDNEHIFDIDLRAADL